MNWFHARSEDTGHIDRRMTCTFWWLQIADDLGNRDTPRFWRVNSTLISPDRKFQRIFQVSTLSCMAQTWINSPPKEMVNTWFLTLKTKPESSWLWKGIPALVPKPTSLDKQFTLARESSLLDSPMHWLWFDFQWSGSAAILTLTYVIYVTYEIQSQIRALAPVI